MDLFLMSNKRAFESEALTTDITFKFPFIQQCEFSKKKSLQVVSDDKPPDVGSVDGFAVFT